MKISYVASVCAYGGTETAIKNRMDYLKDMGVETEIIFLHKGFEEELFRDYTHFIAKSYNDVVQITKDSDIVDALSSSVYYTINKLDKNLVAESHYGQFDFLKRKSYGKGIKAIIFPTMARLYEGKPYIPKGISSFVIPNCLGKNFIEGKAFAKYPEKKDIKTILWVGRLDDGKNWRMLPKLADRLPDNYKIKVITGVYEIERYKNLLEKLQEKQYLNKIELVINCPYDKIAEHYLEAASSGCYLSTSYFESFGMTVLEAMASMCPMVLTNLRSFKEVAGDSALYFSPDDVDACLNSIITICNDNSVRTSLLSKMKDIYILNFDPVKICNNYVNAMYSIID